MKTLVQYIRESGDKDNIDKKSSKSLKIDTLNPVEIQSNDNIIIKYSGSYLSDNPGTHDGSSLKVQGYSFTCNHNRDIETDDINIFRKFIKAKYSFFKKNGFGCKQVTLTQTIIDKRDKTEYRISYCYKLDNNSFVFTKAYVNTNGGVLTSLNFKSYNEISNFIKEFINDKSKNDFYNLTIIKDGIKSKPIVIKIQKYNKYNSEDGIVEYFDSKKYDKKLENLTFKVTKNTDNIKDANNIEWYNNIFGEIIRGNIDKFFK